MTLKILCIHFSGLKELCFGVMDTVWKITKGIAMILGILLCYFLLIDEGERFSEYLLSDSFVSLVLLIPLVGLTLLCLTALGVVIRNLLGTYRFCKFANISFFEFYSKSTAEIVESWERMK